MPYPGMIALHPSISLRRLDDLAIFLPSPTPQPRCLARRLLHLLAMTMFFWGKLNGALKIPTHPTFLNWSSQSINNIAKNH
jgi:hypothetical protein